MQPLRLATDPEAGLVQVLERCRGHVVAHGISEALAAPSSIPADPGNGRGDQRHPEEIRHRLGQPLLRQQLVMQQVEHKGGDPRAVLYRRGDPWGKGRPRLPAAGRATAGVRAMFGDDQRPRFGKVEHLPGDVVGRHRRGQRRAARRAGLRVMVDGGVGIFGPPQGPARMARLPARLLAGRLPQVADPRRLLQPVAGRGLAAVAAVQSDLALQLGDPLSQRRHLRRVARLLRQQQLDQVTFRELVEGGAIHCILESTARRRVKQNLRRHRRHPLIHRASPCADRDAARRHPPGQNDQTALDPSPANDADRPGQEARPEERALELWGGIECTVLRVRDTWRDQLREGGHYGRIGDLDAVAGLGLKKLRYPVLWEHVAPERPGECDWRWHDGRLGRLRELGVTPIAGLVHHGGGPRYTDLLDPRFPALLAEQAGRTARRYPWIRSWTPVNEPLTTAGFSGLYGHWHPHGRDEASFLRMLANECRAVLLSMRAIRSAVPDAELVQTEDLGRTFSTSRLAYQTAHENERRWLS